MPPNKAIVGANAFAHEAGIHQDGMLKHELTYEIMRPESVGAPGTRLVLGKHSGMRGLDARCRALGHRLRQPELERLYAKVTALADRTKTVDDEQLANIIREELATPLAVGARCRPRRRDVSLKIVLLPGDGIGPEVTEEAVRILKNVAEHSGKSFSFSTHPIGGVAIDSEGARPARAHARSGLGADAVLLGAVGHPKFEGRLPAERPEAALLALRQALGGFANLRPAMCYAPLAKRTAFQPERVKGANLLIVRELLGGLYYGEPRGFEASGNTAFNTLIYSRHEIERVAKVAFERARERRKKVASIDKANVLETSRLWRAVVSEIAKGYPDVELEHVFVDTARDAPGDVADQLRRHAVRQPVRRHPERSGGVDRRIARRAAVGDAWRQGRSVRAGPRLGAGYRGQGPGQSDRRDCQCGHAAPLHARRWRKRRRKSSTPSKTRWPPAPARRTSPVPANACSRRAKWARRSKTRSHDVRDRRHSYHAV